LKKSETRKNIKSDENELFKINIILEIVIISIINQLSPFKLFLPLSTHRCFNNG